MQIARMQRDLLKSKTTKFSWSKIGEQAEKIMEIVAEHDPQALKSAYRALFDSVVIGSEDKNGIRSVSYIVNHEDWNPHGLTSEMVDQRGSRSPLCSPIK